MQTNAPTSKKSSIHSLDYRQKPKCHAYRLTIKGYTVAKIDGEIPSFYVRVRSAPCTHSPSLVKLLIAFNNAFDLMIFLYLLFSLCVECKICSLLWRPTENKKPTLSRSCKIKENKLTIQSIEGKNGFCRQTWIESTEENSQEKNGATKKKLDETKQIVRVWVY